MKPVLPLIHTLQANSRQETASEKPRAANWVRVATFAGLTLLVVAVSTDRFSIQTQEINFRTELLVGSLLALFCFVMFGLGALRSLGCVELLLGAWWLVGAFSSLVFSPNRGATLKFTVLIAGLLVIYLVASMLLRSREALKWAAVAWVLVGAVVMALGLLLGLGYTAFGGLAGIDFNRYYDGTVLSATPMVYGTMWEANIFGSYSLTVVALAFALARSPEFASQRWQWTLRGATALAFCGTLLSMTRTVWVAGTILLLLTCVISLKLRLLSWRGLMAVLIAPALAGGAIGFVVGNAMPSVSIVTDNPWNYSYEQIQQIARQATISQGTVVQIQATPTMEVVQSPSDTQAEPVTSVSTSKEPALLDRLTELFQFGQVPTFITRQKVIVKAIDGWLQKPVFGWGFGAYPYVYPPPLGESDWIPNLELHLLFDTGIVGLLLFGAAIVIIARRGILGLRTHPNEWNTTQFILFGLLLGSMGLLFAYQLTEATWLGFTWVFLAMLVAAGRFARAETSVNVMRDA